MKTTAAIILLLFSTIALRSAAVASPVAAEDQNETTTVAPESVTEPVTITTEVETTAEPVETSTTDTGGAPNVTTAAPTVNITMPPEEIKDKLSEQIRKVLKHYQQSDPEGFPDAPIPDPLSIPPMAKNAFGSDMTFFNMTVHGLSKFRIDSINVDLKKMQVYVLLKIKRMFVFGNYTLNPIFGRRTAGPFNVTLMDVDAEAAAALKPDADSGGALQATDTEMDMAFRDCVLDFGNLGLGASMFQGVLSSMGPAMFEGIKPFVVDEVTASLRDDVNARVRAITGRLPKLTAPVPDLAVEEARRYVRRMGYDPFRVADRRVGHGPLNVTVRELTVRGLSDFRRVGDIGLRVRGTVLQLSARVITGPVRGTLRWHFRLALPRVTAAAADADGRPQAPSLADVAVAVAAGAAGAAGAAFEQSGWAEFTADHVQVRAMVNQSLDVRQRPVLDDLQIEVGQVTVRTDRTEPLGYVFEAAVNSLPALLRHMIVDALEQPIKAHAQTLLDEVQLEPMVEERLPELDRLQEDGPRNDTLPQQAAEPATTTSKLSP